MVEFADLLAEDKQLQFAKSAIGRYKRDKTPDFIEKDSHYKKIVGKISAQSNNSLTGGFGLANRRHIVNVDDISKINYEMIKNSPGNMVVVNGGSGNESDSETRLESEVNGLKTKLFKNHLYSLNEDYLKGVDTKVSDAAAAATVAAGESPEDIPLEDQSKWLKQIQIDLIGTYTSLVEQEKKWFAMKELLLDANAELDLFSTREVRKSQPNINMGEMDISSNPYSNISTLVFHKRKKRKLNIESTKST
ncbi:hypothetical protein Kpol_1058p26 [Vanderwaltozyma polyspora DSM 70294]|uniref:Uncharacterized protein n=1 Tax=Vanderwaltozyma polyspora (strain ATCC 22028 / DSM 70294 / BCRC 21397 / CBS 2163 / NBRC 10782 / NRRL Y-8283 / UCD 57-17) TaxID=436907 RepID=A7TJR0_VANPO|nr:uncharacterized protein Kpol_1058p26 [Vanderwaltozyma polyspora DSM 70294]EDO17489.1 hypothetical protein Kpol_1058p26 [Vanderwaltozyma polyspora DSM 70294]